MIPDLISMLNLVGRMALGSVDGHHFQLVVVPEPLTQGYRFLNLWSDSSARAERLAALGFSKMHFFFGLPEAELQSQFWYRVMTQDLVAGTAQGVVHAIGLASGHVVEVSEAPVAVMDTVKRRKVGGRRPQGGPAATEARM